VDLYMPGGRGTEVLRKTRQTYPDVPVVMMSGGGNDSVNEALAEHRPDAVLSKPFSLGEVIDLARQTAAAS
jgi:CheY-like chemotaxis protein